MSRIDPGQRRRLRNVKFRRSAIEKAAEDADERKDRMRIWIAVLTILLLSPFLFLTPSSLYVIEGKTSRFAYMHTKQSPSITFSNAVVQVDRTYFEDNCAAGEIVPAPRSWVEIEHLGSQVFIRVTPGQSKTPGVVGEVRVGTFDDDLIETADKSLVIEISPDCKDRTASSFREEPMIVNGINGQIGMEIVSAGFGLTALTPALSGPRVAVATEGGYISGQLQAYSRSIFCLRFLSVYQDQDCSIYSTLQNPALIPPGAGIAPERHGLHFDELFGIVSSWLAHTEPPNSDDTTISGSVQIADHHLAVSLASEADIIRIFQPEIAGVSHRSSSFRVNWIERIMLEPIVVLFIAFAIGSRTSPIWPYVQALTRPFGRAISSFRRNK